MQCTRVMLMEEATKNLSIWQLWQRRRALKRFFPKRQRVRYVKRTPPPTSDTTLDPIGDFEPDSTTFHEKFRMSGAAYPIEQGDRLKGVLVGYQKPRDDIDFEGHAKKVAVVDFGMKNEVPFNPKEIPEAKKISQGVTMPIMGMENEFNEPNMDFDRLYDVGDIKADRMKLLRPPPDEKIDCPPILFGRYSERRNNLYRVKALGKEGLVQTNHAVRLSGPLVGTHSFFALLRLDTKYVERRGVRELRYEPFLSAYVAHILILANLVIRDPKSPPEKRLAYLRILTRLAFERNNLVRQYHARQQESSGSSQSRFTAFAEWFGKK